MRIRRTTSLAAVIIVEASALLLLTRLGSYAETPAGWSDVGRWLAETAPEDAVVAVVRLLALGLAWWLTGSTVLYVLARATRVPALIRGVRWVTLPSVPRMVDGVLATTLVATSTLGGGRIALAEPAQVGPVVVQLDQGGAATPAPTPPAYQPRPAGDDAAPCSGTTPRDTAVRTTTTAVPATPTTQKTRTTEVPPQPSPPVRGARVEDDHATRTYIVRAGDNFWSIAKRQVETAPGGDASDNKHVAAYWVQLIDTNRHKIRSSDPNLIYPGEAITLPPQGPAP